MGLTFGKLWSLVSIFNCKFSPDKGPNNYVFALFLNRNASISTAYHMCLGVCPYPCKIKQDEEYTFLNLFFHMNEKFSSRHSELSDNQHSQSSQGRPNWLCCLAGRLEWLR